MTRHFEEEFSYVADHYYIKQEDQYHALSMGRKRGNELTWLPGLAWRYCEWICVERSLF